MIMKQLAITLLLVLGGCCPLESGDIVQNIFNDKRGIVMDVKGLVARDCTCLVLYDDKTWSKHQSPSPHRVDSRYADNWDFEEVK